MSSKFDNLPLLQLEAITLVQSMGLI